MDNLIIKEIAPNDNIPYDLLYEADPSEENVKDYIKRGKIFVAILEKEIVGICILLATRPFTIEIVNLSVKKEYQGKGFAKKLINNSISFAKQNNSKTLEIGTGNSSINQLALYQKCGFTITHVDFDFFTKYYPEPIIENGIECRHMIRLSLDLYNK